MVDVGVPELCSHTHTRVLTTLVAWQTDMRLWDVFLYDGSEILLLIALAIFKLFEEVPSLHPKPLF